jgi:Clp amino terminal domain, pathogenicity island component
MTQDDPSGELAPTPRYQQILDAANGLATVMGHTHVGVEHLFLAIIRDQFSMPAQSLSRTADLAGLHRDFLEYLQAAYPEPFLDVPAYPEQHVPDFTGAEKIWLGRGDLDGPLRDALVSALPAGAPLGFNYAGDRGWVEVGRPGDTRSVLSAALRALGREPLAPQ